MRLTNQPSAYQHATFVSAEVKALLAAKAISVAAEPPHCVFPLGVVPKPRSQKLRLILDMRRGNECMPDQPFKMESLADLRFLAQPGDLLLSLDLTQGYHHVTIHPTDRKYLGFQWNDMFFHFNVLPFGLKPAPRIFTKVVTLLARSWRADGIRVLIYLDDWLFLVRPEEADSVRQRVLNDCRLAHFAINLEKSSLTGTPSLTHLGIHVDLHKNLFSVPEHKRSDITAGITAIYRIGRCSARALSRITGKKFCSTSRHRPTNLLVLQSHAQDNRVRDILGQTHPTRQRHVGRVTLLDDGRLVPIRGSDLADSCSGPYCRTVRGRVRLGVGRMDSHNQATSPPTGFSLWKTEKGRPPSGKCSASYLPCAPSWPYCATAESASSPTTRTCPACSAEVQQSQPSA